MYTCLILFFLFICGDSQKFYDSRYDYYDTDYLVENPRLLKKYINCFLNEGPCTPIGKDFKLALPEIVRTACSRCSPSQKRLAQKTFEAFNLYLHDDYNTLKSRLDPENRFFGNFLRTISKKSR
ncbi:unnamed protein product [Pieris macdunnoughi]|uniref:Uncharacterized protein n=1 Tax=Pieris macdunnoughi TaxID=345717 RepID=A0A821PHI3_9NEOP|nr:unnamed protein product [Pieris macdunnoughi]